jgi:hypothetical protein
MVAVANHTPSPADRLTAFIHGGGHLGLDRDELASIAKTWSAWIVNHAVKGEQLLHLIGERALEKYTIAASRDIAAARQKYNRWLLAQRKRVDEVGKRRAEQRRDQAIQTAIAGLIISLKYVQGGA